MNAPHPLNGINNFEGADVESAIYASFSLEILSLSKICLILIKLCQFV